MSGIGIATGGSKATSDFGDFVDAGSHITGLANIAKHEARYQVIPGGSDPATGGTKENAAFIPISFGLIS